MFLATVNLNGMDPHIIQLPSKYCNRLINPMMLVVSLVFAICCCMTLAAPTDQLLPSAQTLDLPPSSPPTFTIKVENVRTVFLPITEKAVGSILSFYKLSTRGIGRMLIIDYVATLWSLPEVSVYRNVIEEAEIQIVVGKYFDAQLDLLLKAAHDKFMLEISNVLEAAEQKATIETDSRVEMFELIPDVMAAHRRAEQALRKELLDFVVKSVPNMLAHACQVGSEVACSDSKDKGYRQAFSEIPILKKIIFFNGLLLGSKIKHHSLSLVKDLLLDEVPDIVSLVLKSEDAVKSIADAVSSLDKLFLPTLLKSDDAVNSIADVVSSLDKLRLSNGHVGPSTLLK